MAYYLASTRLPVKGGSSGQCWHTLIDPLTTHALLICHNASVGRCVTVSGPCDGTPWSPGHAHPRLSHLSHLPAAPIDQKCARSTHICLTHANVMLWGAVHDLEACLVVMSLL